MALKQSYPASQYEASPLIDLSDSEVRERLSRDAVRAFVNIMDRWKIRGKDARELLGGMSNGSYYDLKRREDRVLDADLLYRSSYLVGIFKALNILYSEELADRWMQLPNTNRIFGGKSPMEYLIRGGPPAFGTLRKLLDARRGGV